MKKAIIIIASILAVAGVVAGIVWFITKNNPTPEQPDATPKTEEQLPSFVDRQMKDMTTRQKVATMLMHHVPGTNQTTLSDFLSKYQPAGLIFMGDNTNISDAELTTLTTNLQTDPDLPYLFGVDEEGGIVKRLDSDTYPAAVSLRNQPASVTQDTFQKRTTLLKNVGLNLDFGIIADVTADPNSFIYERVLGTTPDSSAERVSAAIKGSVEGTLSTIKHFPGHGETTGDSHLSVPVVANVSKSDWQQRDMIPFKAGIDAGANMLMFGHLTYSQIDSKPASLSSVWHQIARDELGFKGIIVTDSMSMLLSDPSYTNNLQNYIDAINAGSDLILSAANAGVENGGFDVDALIDGIVAAVESGQIPESRIDESARRILEIRHSLI